jgi:hypothetical protein
MSCFEPPIIPESEPVIQTNPIVQDQSAYVYHEIKSHKEPYLSTIIEEEYVKPVVFQEPVLVKEPVLIKESVIIQEPATHQESEQPKQQHKKKKHRK